ncbi:hypothetical protein [Herpetosiphon geysericola]|uniref:Uncharacterized protein n=1 Tax=Herpetosiphon geysericola TaxID=70996 RepID=A0A0P6YHS3_9CHLR|nr:hypothetical protein [Herpetosiphon geysericola]KPL90021.1 hypothetical protein SE18_08700 [Herpetosiphon geysericola]
MSGKTKPQSTDAPAETAEPTTTAAATPKVKIVRTPTQDYQFPSTATTAKEHEAENLQIKAQLVAMGFPDMANAEIKQTTNDGQVIVEFVKKVGTKG